jgi:hypothetical protein
MASALICSLSNSSRVRMSTTRVLRPGASKYSRRSSGRMVFDAGITDFSGTGDDFEESGEGARLLIDGFGAIDGEAGRLMKAFMVGVIGVLEGRGPGSMDNDGKCLNRGEVGISTPFTPFGCEIDDRWVIPLLPVGCETGTDGNLDVNSSNSSIDGKACENSAIVE